MAKTLTETEYNNLKKKALPFKKDKFWQTLLRIKDITMRNEKIAELVTMQVENAMIDSIFDIESQLKFAFEKVKNPENWKLECSAEIDEQERFDLINTAAAMRFYCGGYDIYWKMNGKIILRSSYYRFIGA